MNKPLLIVFRLKPKLTVDMEEIYKQEKQTKSQKEKNFEAWLKRKYPNLPDTRREKKNLNREEKIAAENRLFNSYSIDQLFRIYLDVRRLGRKKYKTWNPSKKVELSFLGGRCSSLDAALRRLLIKHDKLKFKGHLVS